VGEAAPHVGRDDGRLISPENGKHISPQRHRYTEKKKKQVVEEGFFNLLSLCPGVLVVFLSFLY
jgi:hypothetical protein